MGVLRRRQPDDPTSGAELIGMIDFRLHWPGSHVVTIGMMLVAEPLQRQGIGAQAWRLLAPWLAGDAGMHRARLAVQQFNPGALHFFVKLGFHLTGQTDRYRVGEAFVRLLYMEQEWSHPMAEAGRQRGIGGGDGDPGR
jgi:RimJ/RimL family protein N-acetyltransferase